MSNKRNRNIRDIPKERQKIRPNVEATMKEFKTRTRNGKIKIRGIFKTNLFAFNVGIAINFGRIYRYLVSKGLNIIQLLSNSFIKVHKSIKKVILGFLNREIWFVRKELIYFSNMQFSAN